MRSVWDEQRCDAQTMIRWSLLFEHHSAREHRFIYPSFSYTFRQTRVTLLPRLFWTQYQEHRYEFGKKKPSKNKNIKNKRTIWNYLQRESCELTFSAFWVKQYLCGSSWSLVKCLNPSTPGKSPPECSSGWTNMNASFTLALYRPLSSCPC